MLQKLREKFKFIHTKTFKLISSFITLSIIGLSCFGGYLYVYEDKNIIELLSGTEKEKDDINYAFNLEGSFENRKNGIVKESGNFSLKDGEIVVKDKGLKQRIKVGDLNISNGEENKSIKNLDVISDNEKIYYFLEKGYEEILNNLGLENNEEIKKSFEAKQYIMIDNSKPLIKALGDLAKNDLMRKIATGLVTSNPEEYFEQNGVNDELKEYIQSDEFLDYIFVEGEYNSVSKKTNLTLNKKICNDYDPVMEKILEQLGEKINLGQTGEECSVGIDQINTILPMFMQIYKQGDVQNGNFTLSIIQGNVADIQVTYKNHKVETWYINIKSPDNSISLNIVGNKDKIVSSLLKINIDIKEGNDYIKINGLITNGTGEININGEIEKIKVNGFITFVDYKLFEYNLTGKGEEYGAKLDIVAKGNLEHGITKASLTYNEEVIAKGTLNYTKDSFHIEGFNENTSFNIDYKKQYLDIKLNSKDWRGNIVLDAAYNYDAGVISGHAKGNGLDATINGNVVSINDYNIEIKEKNTNSSLILKGIKKATREAEHSIDFTDMGKEVFNLLLNLKASRENGFNIINGKLDVKLPKQSIDNTYNLKLGTKKGAGEYIIPEQFKEIEVKLSEISVMPSIYDLTKIDNTIVLGGAALAGAGGTVAYVSLQGYSADARNSKRISDIGNIQSAITLKQIEGVPLKSFVIVDKKYAGKSVYVGGKELIFGENYFVGTLNYNVLNINKKDFLDPDGNEYIIGVSTASGGSFQILAYMEQDDNMLGTVKVAKINGTFNPRERKVSTITVTGDNKIVVPYEIANYYRKGDYTNLGKIEKASIGGIRFTLSKNLRSSDKVIYLLKGDSKGLIYINGKVIVNEFSW